MSSSLKRKIALIEDDENTREMYRIKLELNGYEVATAESGKKALNLVKKEKPDLVLLDILLPEKDGFEILKEIREATGKSVKTVPVIVLSNLSNKEDIEEAKKLGAVGYFVKAKITPKEMVEKVEKFFKKKYGD